MWYVEKGASLLQLLPRTPAPYQVTTNTPRLQVRFLLGIGADPDLATDSGATPIYMAAAHGHLEVVRLLADKGAAVNCEDEGGSTAAFAAASHGHLGVLKFLAESCSVDLKQMTADQCTLFYIAAAGGHTETMRYLAENGAPMHQMNIGGEQATHVAAQEGHVPVMRYLAAEGFDLTLPREGGCTPMFIAGESRTRVARSRCLGLFVVVPPAGAVIARPPPAPARANRPPLSASNGQVGVVRFLAEEKGVSLDEGKDGATPTYMAAKEVSRRRQHRPVPFRAH